MPKAKVMKSAFWAEPASVPYHFSASRLARGENTAAIPSSNVFAGAGVCVIVHFLYGLAVPVVSGSVFSLAKNFRYFAAIVSFSTTCVQLACQKRPFSVRLVEPNSTAVGLLFWVRTRNLLCIKVPLLRGVHTALIP